VASQKKDADKKTKDAKPAKASKKAD
jgi:hypothetical protein